jgi:hypothetical protein
VVMPNSTICIAPNSVSRYRSGYLLPKRASAQSSSGRSMVPSWKG